MKGDIFMPPDYSDPWMPVADAIDDLSARLDSSVLDDILSRIDAMNNRMGRYAADASAATIARVRALYERPGTPGEKQAAAEALRRLGVPVDEPAKDPWKGSAWEYVDKKEKPKEPEGPKLHRWEVTMKGPLTLTDTFKGYTEDQAVKEAEKEFEYRYSKNYGKPSKTGWKLVKIVRKT